MQYYNYRGFENLKPTNENKPSIHLIITVELDRHEKSKRWGMELEGREGQGRQFMYADVGMPFEEQQLDAINILI